MRTEAMLVCARAGALFGWAAESGERGCATLVYRARRVGTEAIWDAVFGRVRRWLVWCVWLRLGFWSLGFVSDRQLRDRAVGTSEIWRRC